MSARQAPGISVYEQTVRVLADPALLPRHALIRHPYGHQQFRLIVAAAIEVRAAGKRKVHGIFNVAFVGEPNVEALALDELKDSHAVFAFGIALFIFDPPSLNLAWGKRHCGSVRAQAGFEPYIGDVAWFCALLAGSWANRRQDRTLMAENFITRDQMDFALSLLVSFPQFADIVLVVARRGLDDVTAAAGKNADNVADFYESSLLC
ncbi:hypothetical protein V497_02936 [Pseudogymnoascus sp. VKM F-4516 (FW-969)]|nr:hypothetical protein V497_02936 [Pseudogymnoascus sp. VKM F-4516 (FW-969)]